MEMVLFFILIYWKWLGIPLIAAFVGWSTNWLALKLMFYPVEFFGYHRWRLGWQGIIPSKAKKMAKVVVDKGLSSLATITEVYEAIDHQRLADEFYQIMDSHLDEYVDEIMHKENQVLWDNLPVVIKGRILNSVRDRLPILIDVLLEDVGDNIDSLIDLEDLVASHLVANKALLNRIFHEAGERELKFIVRSGAYFGFLFGIVQMLVWWLLPQWWVLPFFGLFVGCVTNWLAIQVIFSPLRPISIGPITLQGLFLRRQRAIAKVFCKITADEVLTVDRVLAAMLLGPKSKRMHQLIQYHISRTVDEVLASFAFGVSRPIVQAFLGLRGFAALKAQARMLAIVYAKREVSQNHSFNEGQQKRIEHLLRGRMVALSPEEFQSVLRPAFQEDEWILVSLGALLGMCAGWLQWVFVFGGS